MIFGAICDDDKSMHKELQQYFAHFVSNTLYKLHISYFSSGEDLLHHYENQGPHSFQFLILDVEMKGINGIETAMQVRSLPDREVQIIFLTGYPDYMMDSFDVQTFQYLIKPLSYPIFETKMAKLCDYILASANRYLLIKTDREQIKLRTSEIIAIVKIKHSLVQNKLQVITSQHQYTTTGTLKRYLEELGTPFLPIYRSVIVNMEYIRKFTLNSVIMSNQQEFPIGRTKLKSVKNTYAYFMAEQFIK